MPQALVACRAYGLKFDVMSTSLFLSRRALLPAPGSKMSLWQDRLFYRPCQIVDDASKYFGIPSGRAVEIGTQIHLKEALPDIGPCPLWVNRVGCLASRCFRLTSTPDMSSAAKIVAMGQQRKSARQSRL
jgi:hypothetical protein